MNHTGAFCSLLGYFVRLSRYFTSRFVSSLHPRLTFHHDLKPPPILPQCYSAHLGFLPICHNLQLLTFSACMLCPFVPFWAGRFLSIYICVACYKSNVSSYVTVGFFLCRTLRTWLPHMAAIQLISGLPKEYRPERDRTNFEPPFFMHMPIRCKPIFLIGISFSSIFSRALWAVFSSELCSLCYSVGAPRVSLLTSSTIFLG